MAILLAAARRFAVLLLVSAAVTALVSAGLGLLTDTSPRRAISLGFYGLGSFLLVAGFFIGNRGPARLRSDAEGGGILPIFGPRRVRWATAEEHREVISSSAIFVSLGLALILAGIMVDDRYELL
jgi:hypothetical protein